MDRCRCRKYTVINLKFHCTTSEQKFWIPIIFVFRVFLVVTRTVALKLFHIFPYIHACIHAWPCNLPFFFNFAFQLSTYAGIEWNSIHDGSMVSSVCFICILKKKKKKNGSKRELNFDEWKSNSTDLTITLNFH